MHRFPRFLLLGALAGCAIGASLSANAQAQSYRYRQAGSVRESPPLRPMPLIVVSAGRMARGSDVPLKFWHELQGELAAQLPQARHTIAERSDHFIQREQPQFVWASVRDIVVALRGQ